MRLLRPGLLALALSSVTLAQGATAAAAAANSGADACDVICEMQAYLNRDHMVTFVPAAVSPAPAGVEKAKKAPHKAVAAVRLPRKAQPAAVAVPGETTPLLRRTALLTQAAPASPPRDLPPPASGPVPPPATVIPGGAPLVAARFIPPMGGVGALR